VTTEKVFDLFKDDASDHLNYFRDISTFGGCTAGPAAAIENMKIIERENLLENCTAMGDYMLDELHALGDKHANVGQARGKGLFLGLELVEDRASKTPLPEQIVAKVVGDCMAQGVIIGATNRSVPGKNNTLCFSPALIATKDDINQIVSAVDGALGRVLG
jgi:taurine-pyruvate aminotransferase